jgi:DNA-binding NtrC family response regulator
MVKRSRFESRRMALLVHPDVGTLTVLQTILGQNQIIPIVARDLPTALLAVTQHYFDLAVVNSRIREEGDGWPLAAVLRMVFPKSLLAVLTPDTDVLTMRSAINSGIDEVYERERTLEQIAADLLSCLERRQPVATPKQAVQ